MVMISLGGARTLSASWTAWLLLQGLILCKMPGDQYGRSACRSRAKSGKSDWTRDIARGTIDPPQCLVKIKDYASFRVFTSGTYPM